jgi:hypothetical protein
VSSSSIGVPPAPEGPGSASGAPNLPAGFTDTFTSRYIDTGELRLHAVSVGSDAMSSQADPDQATNLCSGHRCGC